MYKSELQALISSELITKLFKMTGSCLASTSDYMTGTNIFLTQAPFYIAIPHQCSQ